MLLLARLVIAHSDVNYEEVEAAVKTLKKGVDNIPAEMVQAGGEDMISVLLIICNKIWQTGEWPTQWTQSLVITLPKRATYSYARIIAQSASLAIQAKLC